MWAFKVFLTLNSGIPKYLWQCSRHVLNLCASRVWQVHGMFVGQNVTFELTVRTVIMKKDHADSA